MKKTKTYQVITFILITAIITGCGGLGKMKKLANTINYSVKPEVLEMHADSVAVQISGTYPAKYFSKKAVITATPVVKWEGGEKAYPSISVQGEKVEDNHNVINYVNGGSFSYNGNIPFIDDMKVSELEIRVTAAIGSKTVDFDPVVVAQGVIATPGLLQADAKAIMEKDGFVRITSETKSADIHFAIQTANIRGGELRDEDIKALKDFIADANENERKQMKGASISAYASPDGAQDLNTKLAENRAKSAEKYVAGELRKVEGAKEDGFVTSSSTPEDWDGFKQMMQESEIGDKDLILKVLSMHSDPDVREKEIKNIAAVYLSVAEQVLPKLRRSKLNINVDLVGYSDDELKELFKSNPDTLNVEEILFTATLKEDLAWKIEVYSKASELFATDWRTHNNLGYSSLADGKIDEAKSAFEKAKELDDSNTKIVNNLAAIELYNGNYSKAKELLESAAGAGPEVNYNTGIILVKEADYAGAVSAFGDECSFNTALAKILNGDAAGAVKTLDCIEDKENAMVYYLKAIAGARQGDSDIMYNNLRTAISKDGGLSAKAKKDMEFGKFFEDDTFKSIVQ